MPSSFDIETETEIPPVWDEMPVDAEGGYAPKIRSIEDVPSLSEMPEEHIEYLVDRLIPRGAVLFFSGEAGHGKSTLLTAIAGAVSKGTSFAGLATQQAPVLYLDRENPKAIAQERLKRLHVSTNSTFIYWGGWLPDEAPALASPIVLEWVTQTNPKPLIIADSLIAFIDGDENDSTVVRGLINQARQLSNLGASVVLLHHPGKSEGARDYRGSSDLKAAVDCAFRLTNSGEGCRLDRILVKAIKMRFPVTLSMLLTYRDGCFDYDDRPQVVSKSLSQQLGELLIKHPRATTRKFGDFASAAGLGRDKAYQFLRDGVEMGTVRQEKGTGKALLHYLNEDFHD